MTAVLQGIVFFFAIGAIIGTVHFRALAWNVRLLTGGVSLPAAIGVPVIRLAITGSSLIFVAMRGAGALLAAMLGFLVVRALVVYHAETPR